MMQYKLDLLSAIKEDEGQKEIAQENPLYSFMYALKSSPSSMIEFQSLTVILTASLLMMGAVAAQILKS
jgi:hypothetical protein